MNDDFYWFDCKETTEDSSMFPSAQVVRGTYMRCIIDSSCWFDDEKKRNIVANCIYMFLKKKPFYKKSTYWVFIFDERPNWRQYYDEYFVNIYDEYVKYPKSINSKIDLILLNLSLCLDSISSNLGITFLDTDFRSFLPEADGIQSYFESEMFLIERGYFDQKRCVLTAKGWERVEQIESVYSLNQIFIASQFKGFDSEIGTIKEAIKETGYLPVCMDDHQTNNYIMPEIFNLIKNSKAIVGEISSNNSGVYYEIGYAKGLNKEIILVCKQEVDENGNRKTPIHFDIAQVSIIFYKDLDDLKKQLIFRIKNTISQS